MIKTLQKKFIITTMLVVSILIVGMVGAFNIVNYYTECQEYEKTLDILETEASRSPEEGSFGDRPDEAPPWDELPQEEKEKGEKQEPPQEEMERGPKQEPPQGGFPEDDRGFFQSHTRIREEVRSARTFWILIGKDGEILDEDIERMVSLTQKEAEEKAKDLYANWKETKKSEGMIQKLKYRVKDNKHGPGVWVFFLDTTTQFYSRMSMMLASLYVGGICWLLMLLLAFLLSKRAIRPIAENIERQKQFVTNAGHEIKTPLAIIMANTDAMELIQGESKWSKNIRSQTVRLNGLMQTLLTLSRMEEQTFEYTTVALSQLLEETVQPYNESVAVQHIMLTTEIEPNVWLRGNEESLRQLISILLDNARKYTKKDGRIDVCLSSGNGKAVFEVKNTCDTLPKAPPEKLFERFYRGDDARTQKSGGYGIGLSVAKAIVESHKGTIQAVYGSEPSMCIQVSLQIGQQKKEKEKRRERKKEEKKIVSKKWRVH